MLRLTLVFVVFGAASAALAQEGPKVERPELKVGDLWSYQRVNRDGTQIEVRREIKAVTPESLTAIVKDAAGTTEQQWTPELNYLRGEGPRVERPHQQYYSFPLAVGRQWKVDKKGVGTSGRDFKSEGACNVVAFEKVETKAGAFDAFKVNCETDFILYGARPILGRERYVYWYAPAARGEVRAERLTRDAISVFVDWTQDLVATSVN